MNALTGFMRFRGEIAQHFDEHMAQDSLFVVDVNPDELWNTYLTAFPDGTNPMFRKRTVHDCSECRSFIQKFGGVVAVRSGSWGYESIWDADISDPTYATVTKAMSKLVHSRPIMKRFLSDTAKIGVVKNFEIGEDGSQIRWDHLYCELPESHVCKKDLGTSVGNVTNAHNVLVNSFSEISVKAVDIVLDLIKENLLYRGQEWEKTLETFKTLKIAYSEFTDNRLADNFVWVNAAEYSNSPIPFLKNRSIGVLLVDISQGKDVEESVRHYEAITDPGVYKRPKPIFTAAMKEAAKNKLVELGFEHSLQRRFATLDDITINDILYADRSVKAKLEGIDALFDGLTPTASSKKQDFSGAETVDISTFLNDILPTATSIEAFVDNQNSKNLVSLIAPVEPDSKPMFTWGNGFSWAYTGNATDSFKQKVAEFGGKVDGVMRFSIKWNEDGHDDSDLDAHCYISYHGRSLPLGSEVHEEIYFGHMHGMNGGNLDVDIRWPSRQVRGDDKTAVENIVWAATPVAGVYYFFVHQYAGRCMKGFRAEIELNGDIYSFDYQKPVVQGEKVLVAVVVVGTNGEMRINPRIETSSARGKKVWGIDTMEFQPVTAIMYSPNHWSTAERQVGHKHVFFMLDGCVNDERPSGIFNEYLVNDLATGNRRVMAALSEQLRVPDSEDQLSGLGFALDKRAELIVMVHSGETKRVMKITF